MSQSEALQIVVDQANLSPEAIPLAPFEVIGGGDLTESSSEGGRFFQREYRLRVVGDSSFGRDVLVPPVAISYRLQTVTPAGDRTQGIERRYELPALTVRVVSLVPADARDIREPTPDTFAALDDAVFRTSIVRTVGAILALLGALGVVIATASAVRARAPADVVPATLPDGLILRRVEQELADVRRSREQDSWSPALVARTLAALRIAACYATGRTPSQRTIAAGEEPSPGAVVYEARGGRRVAVSAATTAESLENYPNSPNRVVALREALASFTRARYGRSQPPAPAPLDAAFDEAQRVIVELRREHGWLARQLAAASKRWSR